MGEIRVEWAVVCECGQQDGRWENHVGADKQVALAHLETLHSAGHPVRLLRRTVVGGRLAGGCAAGLG